MSVLANALYVTGALAGLGVVAVAVHVARRRDTLGVRAFLAYAVALGTGSAVTGVGAAVGFVPVPTQFPMEPTVLVPVFALIVVTTAPLLIFALQFTGRITRIGWGIGLALGVAFALFAVDMVVTWTGFAESPRDPIRLGSAIGWQLLTFAYGAVAAYALGCAAVGDRPLSVGEAVGLTAPVVVTNVGWRAIGAFHLIGGDALAAGAFASVPVTGFLGFAWAVGAGSAFATLPAVRRIGRGAVLEETDDLVVVADADGTVVETGDALGAVAADSIADTLGHTVAELAAATTVTLPDEDSRRYDPQVSRLTDRRGRELGAVITLRDVTARERREQRLTVLNRVLRHNLRNRVEVVRAHAEVLSDGDGHARAVRAAADDIAALGEQARVVDEFLSESGETVELDPAALVRRVTEPDGDERLVGSDGREPAAERDREESVAARDEEGSVTSSDREKSVAERDGQGSVAERDRNVTVRDGDVSVEMGRFDPGRIRTDRRAATAAIRGALDTAVEHAESVVRVEGTATDNGYSVTLYADGDGLPPGERETLSLDRETALQHSTGLDLWKLRWAVGVLGGAVCVPDGEAVLELSLPNDAS